ncbi:MAG: hypothetical protein KDE26_02565 [Bacteroidetes bacterium]|nr:hypothetical protein [Bacteroidota bacterium]MCB0842129.1 hypothetical protein [Bacteroidota bacterium]
MTPGTNKVIGRITHKESGIGLENLIVEVLDIDPRYVNPDHDIIYLNPNLALKDEDFVSPPIIIDDPNSPRPRAEGLPADRLGSVITNAEGYFELSYDDDAFKVREKSDQKDGQNERRPDLYIVITTPESSQSRNFSHVVFRSPRVRVNAGREEHFLIQITSEELKAAGLDLPFLNQDDGNTDPVDPSPTPDPPITFRKQVENSLKKRLQHKAETRAAYLNFIYSERNDAKEKEEKFLKPFSNSISRIDAQTRRSRFFVEVGENVEEKVKRHIKTSLEEVNSQPVSSKRKKRKGWVHLTEEQFQLLKGDSNEDVIELTGEEAEAFGQILQQTPQEEESPLDLIMNHPTENLCWDKTAPESICESIFEPKDDDDDDTTPPPVQDDSGLEPANLETDLPLYVANQMVKFSSPEDPVMFGSHIEDFKERKKVEEKHLRASQEVVGSTISALSLRQGPADTPAFYDFHHVQLAFEHVWQEVFDQSMLDTAEDLYDRIVDFGGEPVAKGETFGMARFFNEARTVKRFEAKLNQNQIPHNVEVLFQISQSVWNQLSLNSQNSLEEKADRIIAINEVISLLDELLNLERDDENIYKNNKIYKKSYDRAVAIQAILRKNSLTNTFEVFVKHPVTDSIILNLTGIDQKTASLKALKEELKNEAQEIISLGEEKDKQKKFNDSIPSVKNADTNQIIGALEQKLKEPYSFKIYAADENGRSINFGVLVTYRQKWEPQAYQAGELVKTIPLAPKETKKYSKKEVRKKKRSAKEIENNLSILKQDSSNTGRAESEIMSKAGSSSNFTQNAEGTYNVFLAEGSTTTQTTGQNSQDSQDVKKNFRESVVKAAQEYKKERKLEITTEDAYESEYTESGEITNPNDEIPVTYLFYELQRRYKIFERIHRVRPVIFVAQEVPKPHEIDEDWILNHDWIIRRALLDDSFIPALNYLGNTLTGREVSLEQMRNNLQLQRDIVNKLKEQLVILKNQVNQRYRIFEAAIDKYANLSAGNEEGALKTLIDRAIPTDALDPVTDFLFGGDADKGQIEAARIRREAAMNAFERATQDRDAMMARMENEVSSLNAITAKYTQELSDYLNMRTQIQRLKLHIKQNILHYMQVIWSHEPTDQRFFRLFNTPVPLIKGNLKYSLQTQKIALSPSMLGQQISPTPQPIAPRHTYTFEAAPEYDLTIEYTTLEQVADMDNMLGFKGNYIIYPLKQGNLITDFMMKPYLDNSLGLRDPDEFGEWSLDDFAKYVCCLKEKLPEEEFTPLIPELEKIYNRLLTNPQRRGEVITVPTGSLFIEALPGTHPILEDFKLAHRAIDVKKVQAEVREMELENIRLAARLLKGELEDPDVERKIVVNESNSDVNIEVSE